MPGERTPVEYGIQVVDELPVGPERSTRLDPFLDQIKTAVEGGQHPAEKWAVIARYGTAPAASGAARTLRQKHGPPEANGWEFTSRKLDGGKSGLFVRFDPSRVVAGEAEKAKAAFDAAQRKAREKQKAKNAAKASGAAGRKAS